MMIRRNIQKYLCLAVLCFGAALSVSAQDVVTESATVTDDALTFDLDSLSDSYLDSVNITKDIRINDYTMVGVQYGVGLSQPMWSPTMKQDFLFTPVNFGIMYTRYGKMFGYMPYFGIQAGLFYTQEGYKFKADDEGFTQNLEGAQRAVIQTLELPVLAHFHFDFWKMKIIAHLGLFGGYRLAIHRVGPDVNPEIIHNFLKTDNRWDYGIKGGLGFAFVFDPLEIHFNASYKYSMSSLYQPDYNSEYYYRFAYPTNIVLSVGVHFQLTKRVGKTNKMLRREAKEQLGLIQTVNNNLPDKNNRKGENNGDSRSQGR